MPKGLLKEMELSRVPITMVNRSLVVIKSLTLLALKMSVMKDMVEEDKCELPETSILLVLSNQTGLIITTQRSNKSKQQDGVAMRNGITPLHELGMSKQLRMIQLSLLMVVVPTTLLSLLLYQSMTVVVLQPRDTMDASRTRVFMAVEAETIRTRGEVSSDLWSSRT
jgi:hypothetical protein